MITTKRTNQTGAFILYAVSLQIPFLNIQNNKAVSWLIRAHLWNSQVLQPRTIGADVLKEQEGIAYSSELKLAALSSDTNDQWRAGDDAALGSAR